MAHVLARKDKQKPGFAKGKFVLPTDQLEKREKAFVIYRDMGSGRSIYALEKFLRAPLPRTPVVADVVGRIRQIKLTPGYARRDISRGCSLLFAKRFVTIVSRVDGRSCSAGPTRELSLGQLGKEAGAEA